jgi:hypothetical protein
MGRKATPGNRSKGGRKKKPSTNALRQKWDYGNERVQALRNLFDAQCIRNGKAVDQTFDGIGQLWALDFLDGHHLDPDILRDTARLYAQLYWNRNGATAPKIGNAERLGFSQPSLVDTGRDILFERWIDHLPTYERSVLEHVVVDYWFSDGSAPFVNRLVSTELLRRGRIPDLIEMESPGDRDMLNALLRALFVLVDGALPARFERRAA